MNMRHKGDQFENAARVWPEIRPEAYAKSDKATATLRIKISEIDDASRRITSDYPHLAVWYCLSVAFRSEFGVEKALDEKNIEAFVARHPPKKIVKRGRRVEMPERPVLPGYVLVRCISKNEALRGLLAFPGVQGVVGGGHSPWRVPFKEMERFKALVASGDLNDPSGDASKYMAGMRLKVIDGPFAGFPAVVAQPVGKSGVIADDATEIAVEIGIFGQVTPATMPLAWLRIV